MKIKIAAFTLNQIAYNCGNHRHSGRHRRSQFLEAWTRAKYQYKG